MDYRLIKTTPEVWAVLRIRHGEEMHVYGSYSAPMGDEHNPPGHAVMQTSYGFRDSPIPFIQAETRWRFESDHPEIRLDEIHEYWLCIPKEEE